MKMSFRYRFEAAHRLTSSASPMCQTPHGHTWYATLTFKASGAELNRDGMLAEFQQVKGPWKSFVKNTLDHSFFYNSDDPIAGALHEYIPGFRGLPTPGDPTTETLAILFLAKAVKLSGGDSNIVPVSIDLQETEVNSVSTSVECEVYKNTLSGLGLETTGWWSSADLQDRSLVSIQS